MITRWSVWLKDGIARRWRQKKLWDKNVGGYCRLTDTLAGDLPRSRETGK
ncbi:hypothetical protein KCP78_23145 [Salmonella enterica subsp. enterica]|nr:hypothetical protein KCP78_23145 [Salmonella enterica subsp. enterica]